MGRGADGVTIDHKNHVAYGNVSSTKDGNKEKAKTVPKKEWVDPENFNAAEWAKQWADPNATPTIEGVEYILKSFGKQGEEISQKIRETNERLKVRPMTMQKYRLSGEGESARYTDEREKLHGEIMTKLLSPDKLRVARPLPGEKPTMMILGGRGGSGKSWFAKNVYNPDKYIVLDADAIKGMLPEFEGWNAQDVHEESSDILEQMIGMCIREGLNVVLDITMKTPMTALAKTLRFKAAGYSTEAHYMHLPAQEAAKRAIGRFRTDNGDFSGRYVPVEAILKNTTNEDSFDQVKGLVDKWSFRDNNVKRGEQPILISEGEKPIKKSFSALVKFFAGMYNRNGG
jgi:predicted kinase